MDKTLKCFVDAMQSTESIMFEMERLFKRQVLDLISVMQEGVGYVAFNEESGFPDFHDYHTDEHCNIFAVKVVTDDDRHHSLMFITDEYYLEDLTDSEGWFYANSWGSFSDVEIFNALKALLND